VSGFEHISTILPRALQPGDRALERALWFLERAFDVLALDHGEKDPDAVEIQRIVARLTGRVIRARGAA